MAGQVSLLTPIESSQYPWLKYPAQYATLLAQVEAFRGQPDRPQNLQAMNHFLLNSENILCKLLQSQQSYNDQVFAEREASSLQEYARQVEASDLRYKTAREAFAHQQALTQSIPTPKPPVFSGVLVFTKQMNILAENTYTQLRLYSIEGGKRVLAEVSSFLFGSPLTRMVSQNEIEWRTQPTRTNLANPNHWFVDGDKVIFAVI